MGSSNAGDLILSLAFFVAFVAVQMLPVWAADAYRAELIKVIDGDTVKLKVALWPGLYQETSLRLAGIDTPESRAGLKGGAKIPDCEIKRGRLAKVFLSEFLFNKDLRVFGVINGKYAGRVLGRLEADGIDVAQHMVTFGHAIHYNGGRRTAWPCWE